jgi:hypothetical protein
MTGCRLGLVLNFGGQTMTDRIERVVNRFPDTDRPETAAR